MNLIEVTHESGVAVVSATGKRLDASIAPAFKQAVVALVAAGDQRLVLDMGRVEFLDSSGLGAMVSILKAMGGRGALAVCNARGAVLSLFQLTRMDKVFLILPARDEAVRRVAAG